MSDDKLSEADPKETPFRSVGSQRLYSNPWIDLVEHAVVHPDGLQRPYAFLHFKKLSVGAVTVDVEGFTWLVGQYRFPIRAYSWEIPMGGGDLEIHPLETARRELREETGIRALRWTQLLRLHTSNTVTDEVAIVYVAQDLRVGVSSPDPSERLRIRRVSFADALAMIDRGEVTEAVSVAALFAIARQRSRFLP